MYCCGMFGFVGRFTSESSDGGITWSAPVENNFPNPNTQVHAIRLTNGHIMVAYNHHKYKPRQRSNLFVAVSTDKYASRGPL